MDKNSRDSFSGTDLTVKRGEKLVFSGLEFRLFSGDVLLLTGHNGSGKSTLLRLMAGLIHSSPGYISWNSEKIKNDLTTHAGRLNYVGHLTGVKLALNVEEDLSFWMKLNSNYDQETIKVALVHFGLCKHTTLPIKFLSSGQKRKLALARLMVRRSKIWLLDEPTIGLDQAGIWSLEEIIKKQRADNGIVVVASHTNINLGNNIKELNLARHRSDNPYLNIEDFSYGK